jgi:DNA-directed RNA polymerase subunit RPC12/RpoP
MHQSHGIAFTMHPAEEPRDSPLCARCGNPLELIRVEPIGPGCEKHTVECPRCGRKETMLVRPPARGTT